jgi:hypothetical protein
LIKDDTEKAEQGESFLGLKTLMMNNGKL